MVCSSLTLLFLLFSPNLIYPFLLFKCSFEFLYMRFGIGVDLQKETLCVCVCVCVRACVCAYACVRACVHFRANTWAIRRRLKGPNNKVETEHKFPNQLQSQASAASE